MGNHKILSKGSGHQTDRFCFSRTRITDHLTDSPSVTYYYLKRNLEFKLCIFSIIDKDEIISYAVVAQCLGSQNESLQFICLTHEMMMAKRLTHLSHSQILATLTSGRLFTLKSICLHTCHRTALRLIPNRMLKQPAKPSTLCSWCLINWSKFCGFLSANSGDLCLCDHNPLVQCRSKKKCPIQPNMSL